MLSYSGVNNNMTFPKHTSPTLNEVEFCIRFYIVSEILITGNYQIVWVSEALSEKDNRSGSLLLQSTGLHVNTIA